MIGAYTGGKAWFPERFYLFQCVISCNFSVQTIVKFYKHTGTQDANFI